MIYKIDIRHSSDIYRSFIIVFGEQKSILNLWRIFEKDHLIFIHNDENDRVTPEERPYLLPMNNNKIKKYDEDQFNSLGLHYEVIV